MGQTYGYMGKILRVELSEKQFTIENEDPAVLRKYLGGMGLGAKILYDEVPAGINWSDPENRLILAHNNYLLHCNYKGFLKIEFRSIKM